MLKFCAERTCLFLVNNNATIITLFNVLFRSSFNGLLCVLFALCFDGNDIAADMQYLVYVMQCVCHWLLVVVFLS